MAQELRVAKFGTDGGFVLIWRDAKPGDHLQGWYPTQQAYENAVKALVKSGYTTPWDPFPPYVLSEWP